MSKQIEYLINNCNKVINEKLEFLVKIAAISSIPSIKGKITKNKLKWRGIKLRIRNNPQTYTIFQRNVQLTPELYVNSKVINTKLEVSFSYDPQKLYQQILKTKYD